MVMLSTWQWWKPPSSRWNTFSVLSFEPTAAKHFSAMASGICSSPAPCVSRNGHLHLLHDAVEPEAFELLHRGGAAVDAENPHQVLGRHRQRRHRAGIEQLEAPPPGLVIVPLRAPGDAAGKAWLERGGARRVIAAEADRHHADALWIDLLAAGEILVGGGGVFFGLGDQRQAAEAHALAVARARPRSGSRCRAPPDPGMPLKYWISLVMSKPSKNTIAGATSPPTCRSGWTNSAGNFLSPYGTSTGSMRGRLSSAAPSANDFTAFL